MHNASLYVHVCICVVCLYVLLLFSTLQQHLEVNAGETKHAIHRGQRLLEAQSRAQGYVLVSVRARMVDFVVGTLTGKGIHASPLRKLLFHFCDCLELTAMVLCG